MNNNLNHGSSSSSSVSMSMSMSTEQLADSILKCQTQLQSLHDKIRNLIVAHAGLHTLCLLRESMESFGVKSIETNCFKQRKFLKGHFGKIYAISWSPVSSDGDTLISASQDGKLIVWDAVSAQKKTLIPLRSAWVMCVCFSPDGTMVASGGLDNLCSIYKVNPPNGHSITAAAASADASSSSSSSSGGHAHSQQMIIEEPPHLELSKHEGYLSDCKFLSNDKVATASGDATIVIWDVNKGIPIQTLKAHDNDVMSIGVSSNGHTLISGGCDCTCRSWDIRVPSSSSCCQTFFGHESDVNAVTWFPDDWAFASASDDTTLRLFDTRCWSEINHYYDKLLAPATTCSFSSSGRLLLAGYDDYTVHVWDTVTSMALPPYLQAGQEGRVGCLQINKPGTAIATGSWDTTLRIFA